MKKCIKKSLITLTIAGLSIGIVGCSNNELDKATDVKTGTQEETRVEDFNPIKFTYTEGGAEYEVIVESPRQRAVTLSQFMTEMLLALGLEDQMVGTALLDNPILPEFEEAYNQIPVIQVGEGHSISKEAFVATGADFVSGWDSSISDQTTGSAEELISKDIVPFMAKSYTPNATVETVYEDFELLGKIFDVEDKALEVINQMKSDIQVVTDKLGNIKEEDRVNMMVYDSGEHDAMVVGSGLANNMIELAGGNNVFAKDATQPYINVSWESVVAKNPEVILVTDFLAGEPVENKINFLKNHPALKDVPAIKNGKIYVVGLADLSPGVRNPKLIEQMYGYFFEESK